MDNETGQAGPSEFVLAAVIEDPATPEVFTAVAYLPDDSDLVAGQFPGREVRMLSPAVLSEHAQAEVRTLLDLVNAGDRPDGVVVGTTDGTGGWASWNQMFLVHAPEPVPELPDQGEVSMNAPAEVQTSVEVLQAAVEQLDAMEPSSMDNPDIRAAVEALQEKASRLVWPQTDGAQEFRT